MMNNIDNGNEMAPPTIFVDIDGTLVEFPHNHNEYKSIANGTERMKLLPGVREKLWDWETKGYKIIITTGRREMFRSETVKALKEAGIGFDQLVMGCGSGPRYVINDRKPGYLHKKDTAFGINVDRDEGFTNLEL